MLMTDGEYVSKFWQVVFRDSPLEVAAVVKQPRGSTEWCVKGRVRARCDDIVGDDSRDLKYWFESPAFATEEEAIAVWWLHLQGFMDGSHLTILEQHEIVVDTASEEAVAKRLMQEKFGHRAAPTLEKEEEATNAPAPPAPPSLLN